jgi:hypothetical protein
MEIISTTHFTYSKTTHEFSAEISELELKFPKLTFVKGFCLVSEHTGKRVNFYLDKIQRDADQDIKFWVFTPSKIDAVRDPKIALLTVVILND